MISMENRDIDLCGAVQLLRQLLRTGLITRQEAVRVARHFAAQHNSSLVFSL